MRSGIGSIVEVGVGVANGRSGWLGARVVCEGRSRVQKQQTNVEDQTTRRGKNRQKARETWRGQQALVFGKMTGRKQCGRFQSPFEVVSFVLAYTIALVGLVWLVQVRRRHG